MQFEICGLTPVQFERPRWNSKSRTVFNTSKYSDFKSVLRQRAEAYRPAYILDVAVKLTVEFFLIPPTKRPRQYPTTRPDLDNYIKAVMDALSPCKKEHYVGFWLDDSYVVDLHASKRYAIDEQPKIIVTIETLD